MTEQYYEIRYCINCGKLQAIVNTPQYRYCDTCLKQNIAECPPPEITEEEWDELLNREEFQNG